MAHLPVTHMKGLARSVASGSWSTPVCQGSRSCIQQNMTSSSVCGLTTLLQPTMAPSQRLLVAAAAKKKPRYTDLDAQTFTDLELANFASVSSMGSMDELPNADKYADLIKQGRGQQQQQQQGVQGQVAQAQAAAASPKTAPGAGKKQANRQPAAFDFGAPATTDDWLGFTSQANDNWDLPQGGGAYINNGFQNAGGYYQQGGGGGYQQQPPQQGGGYYQNGGGYNNQSNGSGGGYYGSGYMNGGGYINNSNGTAMYGQYTSGNGRRGTNSRYDARNGRNSRNSRMVANFQDDDDLQWDNEDEEAVEVRPDSVVISGKTLQANNGITVPLVFVLASGAERKPLGSMPTAQALALAKQSKEDLLLITPDASPPVARIVDWSKYKYEQEKGLKEKKAKATVVEIKEVRLRPTTDSGDLNTKIKSCMKFLEKGNKVKLVMKFEGRELMFKEQGKEVLLKFIEELTEAAKVEGPLNFKSATYTVLMAPTKVLAQAQA